MLKRTLDLKTDQASSLNNRPWYTKTIPVWHNSDKKRIFIWFALWWLSIELIRGWLVRIELHLVNQKDRQSLYEFVSAKNDLVAFNQIYERRVNVFRV